MSEQSEKETILNTTLYTLVRHVGLTPQEVAQLRLSDLHLAGKNPHLSFKPEGSDTPKTMELDLEAHRALVGWLVARPDSIGDFLFPGQSTEAMDWQEIQQLVGKAAKTQPPSPADKPPDPGRSKTSEAKTKRPSASEMFDRASRPAPPPSAPELGVPPPGLAGLRPVAFQPPPTAPEEDKPVNIPLPTSRPKPPPTRPPRPVPVPVTPQDRLERSAPADKPGRPSPALKKEDAIGVKSSPERKQEESQGSKFGQSESFSPEKKGDLTGSRPNKRMGQLTAQEAPAKGSSIWPRLAMGMVTFVLVLLCAVCVGGGWLVWQSEAGDEVLARLGLSDTAAGSFPNESDIMASLTPPLNSPLPTPTLPPTSTPTSLPPTDTPPPTDTATPVPTDTPLPPPTDTPIPADTPTPLPTDTPVSAAPTDTPPPPDTPTPAIKYQAPVLLEPKDGTDFNSGNTIVLRWQSVGELAPDEQYAIRLIYEFQGETTYQGTNIKETEWTIPLSLYGQIDGPENRYEWFVVVERLNDDGSGTAVSPESEKRTFSWR
ncbi:MAG: hypothetical protein JW953_16795 [Anaerolineae bacterium]|nr:hypothetical protein [Anaerolineae bacterium]